MAPVHARHRDCASQKPLTLLRGVTCQVRRPLAFSKVRSEYSLRLDVRRVQPPGGIAGVQVVVDVGALPGAAAGMAVDEIPQPIRHDRAADASRHVVHLRQRRGCRNALSGQSAVRLLDRNFAPVPLAKNEPRNELPPLFGTMFIMRPAVSDSPNPPAVTNVTSCDCPTSTT